MKRDTSIRKNLGDFPGEEKGVKQYVRIFKTTENFALGFRQSGLGMEFDIWLSRDQLRIMSGLLLEALEEDA